MIIETLKILIIEDDHDVREVLKGMLYTCGIKHISEAANGNDALKFIEDNNVEIDIIFCDWNLPAVSGLEILKKVKSASYDFPFIMMTARKDIDSVNEAKALNVTAYISKPFSVEQIRSKLQFVVEQISSETGNTKAQAPNVANAMAHPLNELERLAVLKEKGHLSEEEFEIEKKRLLAN